MTDIDNHKNTEILILDCTNYNGFPGLWCSSTESVTRHPYKLTPALPARPSTTPPAKRSLLTPPLMSLPPPTSSSNTRLARARGSHTPVSEEEQVPSGPGRPTGTRARSTALGGGRATPGPTPASMRVSRTTPPPGASQARWWCVNQGCGLAVSQGAQFCCYCGEGMPAWTTRRRGG